MGTYEGSDPDQHLWIWDHDFCDWIGSMPACKRDGRISWEDVTWQEGEGACGEGGEVLMREERRYGAGDLEALGTGPEAKAPI